MKVKDLIEQLKAHDPEREVFILMSDDYYGVSIVAEITEDGGKGRKCVAICSDEEV